LQGTCLSALGDHGRYLLLLQVPLVVMPVHLFAFDRNKKKLCKQ